MNCEFFSKLEVLPEERAACEIESGGLGFGWGGGPEAELGFAAEFEGGEFAGAGVIPGEELPCGVVVLAGVEIAQQGGRGEASGTQIEGEVDQGVELALVEGDADEARDGGFGDGDVGGEDRLGLGEGYAVWVRLRRVETVTIADGAEASDVRVDAVAEAFRFLEQFKPSGAHAHDLPPKQKGRSAAFPVGKVRRTAYSSKLAGSSNQPANPGLIF